MLVGGSVQCLFTSRSEACVMSLAMKELYVKCDYGMWRLGVRFLESGPRLRDSRTAACGGRAGTVHTFMRPAFPSSTVTFTAQALKLKTGRTPPCLELSTKGYGVKGVHARR